ncbi:tRNA epoxyqueuosine(34) reductase QueG [Algiphilus sp.]|uniref:tRNA epoxyqueuosine(34) reductase QueG n=1 Tax=Algiphilus sp. TaxID=1872431 RepID=UPI0025B8D0B0|nr:tRNA epoxyqueuosine(34) reductase QueG [Algiphilus sp.]MCK5769604.1 tRNA epoxyqueuosine(34) reductase QueG [Algiphilus sp.]
MTASALPRELRDLPGRLRDWAAAEGFSDAAVARPDLDADHEHLRDWLDAGHHGDMRWMADTASLRADPEALRQGTRSVICVRMDYGLDTEAAWPVLNDGSRGYVSRYALGRDYHKVMRKRLARLADRIAAVLGPHGYRVFADSAPVLEKALARNAALGWIGKHTLLLNREAGSGFFLGEIYTDLALPPTEARPGAYCGSCRACIDVCPTGAIVAPYQLDARRCISYLTIEHRGSIPEALRPAIGNRIFGCDDCQLVCPWNRYAQEAAVPDFAPRHGLDSAALTELFAWDEATWSANTEGMALRRAGYRGWLRNIAVALGNAPTGSAVIAALQSRADHEDTVVREHVRWALARHDAVAG